LRTETPGPRMHDLDAHDAVFPGLHEQPPDLPAGDAEKRSDLVLRLVLVVRELGDTDHQQFVIHGILLSLPSLEGARRARTRVLICARTCRDHAHPLPEHEGAARTDPDRSFSTSTQEMRLRELSTWSTMPYSFACSAERILSRSMSAWTFSTGWPV